MFALVPTCKQLTEFKIFTSHGYRISNSALVHLIEWFHHQPVRVFESIGGVWGRVDEEVEQSFYQAVFNPPTLESLKLAHVHRDGTLFSQLELSISTIRLERCILNAELVQPLTSQFGRSGVTNLELKEYEDGTIDVVKNLQRALPTKYIERLNLSGFHIEDSTWCTLFPLIQNCHLETFTLDTEEISSAFAESLALALQGNQTISELGFACVEIAIDDLRLSDSEHVPPKSTRCIKKNEMENASEHVCGRIDCEFVDGIRTRLWW
ncbi:hypothetical protein AC1031_016540 [Aphanomyces cochlioides]|nr:hypothetical protein AC1031_016540 [Aphanomyces cochlioides]